MAERYQLIIIGGGPGGYVAAVHAAKLGLKVAVVEKEVRLGGTCLNIGCIPSKSLLHDTELVSLGVPLTLEQIMKKKENVVQENADGVDFLFKTHKVARYTGTAEIVGPQSVKVGPELLEADHILIATGSEPISLPFLPVDETRVVTSTGALSFGQIPKKLIVIGGGAIGLELASVWRRLGSEITVVEMLPELVSVLDPSISRALLQILTKEGMRFLLNTKVESADLSGPTVKLTVSQASESQTLEADAVLVAVGRRPFTKGLGLEKIGVKLTARGFIEVNDHFQTSIPSIYAIGDVIEGVMLAHKASDEGVAAAEIIAGRHTTLDYFSIPNVVYTHPEAASVGLTEPEALAAAKKGGFELLIGLSSMKVNGRARANGNTEGFAKLIAEKRTGRLLGCHLVSESAGEMIHEAVLALVKHATLHDLAYASHAHPTLNESIKEAAIAALSRSSRI